MTIQATLMKKGRRASYLGYLRSLGFGSEIAGYPKKNIGKKGKETSTTCFCGCVVSAKPTDIHLQQASRTFHSLTSANLNPTSCSKTQAAPLFSNWLSLGARAPWENLAFQRPAFAFFMKGFWMGRQLPHLRIHICSTKSDNHLIHPTQRNLRFAMLCTSLINQLGS